MKKYFKLMKVILHNTAPSVEVELSWWKALQSVSFIVLAIDATLALNAVYTVIRISRQAIILPIFLDLKYVIND